MVLEMLAGGYLYEDIIKEYPHLTNEDIRACLEYAAMTVREDVYPLKANIWDSLLMRIFQLR